MTTPRQRLVVTMEPVDHAASPPPVPTAILST